MALARTTVRVRILVAIDDLAQWIAAGYNYHGDNSFTQRALLDTDELNPVISYYWIEADLPYNQGFPAIAGSVSQAAL